MGRDDFAGACRRDQSNTKSGPVLRGRHENLKRPQRVQFVEARKQYNVDTHEQLRAILSHDIQNKYLG